ncbi:hypothetical protein AMIS_33210 [Actinoplanes missouriensis 431]|uniref:Uncharacterized protein n=1 Tax=Actinoplanes missouriensis (strain ATCC 14538 / DSM 43046 / CBS 188.64 / JCM 3121 / NBRC 102363 / NCIMB 12654 / NRRL B-3342 / UNCC 431) TaxID=512565 RepID=I0H6A4_ACTM4|nr:hypothetical protein [Actinoplanes missouriensis]BAL88541.1 hypothetical protein AMIS_33210 [Actinoplanes missouriensis 431]
MDDTTGRYVLTGQRMGWRQRPDDPSGNEWLAYYPLVGPQLIQVHRVGTMTALSVTIGERQETDVLTDVPWTQTDDEIELAAHVEDVMRRRVATGEIVDVALRDILDQITRWKAAQAG